MEKTSSEILLEAASVLEYENGVRWGKGEFFQLAPAEASTEACVMCAHGAIAYCGRRDIKEAVNAKHLYEANYSVRTKTGPLRKAHEYAMNAGLTFKFNDAADRTKEEVVAKLREAAANARLEGN